MLRLPGSLFGRLALLLLSLLLASQLFTLLLLRYSHQQQESRQLAEQVLDTLAELESALLGFPPDDRSPFLALRNHPYAINLQPAEETVPPPGDIALSPAAERLLQKLHEFGLPVRHARMQLQPKPQLWLPIRMVGERYWLVIPLGTAEPAVGGSILLMAGAFTLLALAAAFGFTWLINRPLQQLTVAATTVAAGQHPEPLPAQPVRELQTLSASFNRMTDALQQAEQERRIMLAGISHDVRTPLTRMRLGVEMMQDDSLRDGMLTDIEDIERIVRQFRDFIAGESDEQPEPLQLNELVMAMVERYRRDGVVIETSLQPALPTVKTRPLALQRVLGNLIDNARRYGRPPLEIHSSSLPGCLSLVLQDHGDGIAAADIERMQQPFTRGDAARQADGGSGLGLAIVRRICRHNNIALQYSQAPGGGLRVELRFRLG